MERFPGFPLHARGGCGLANDAQVPRRCACTHHAVCVMATFARRISSASIDRICSSVSGIVPWGLRLDGMQTAAPLLTGNAGAVVDLDAAGCGRQWSVARWLTGARCH